MNKWVQAWLGLSAFIVAVALAVGIWQGLRIGQDISDATVANENQIGAASEALTGTLDQTTTVMIDVDTAAKHADSTLTKFDAVLDHINAPCRPVKGTVYSVDDDKPCGTLADVARTLHTIRGFAGTLEKAGRHVDQSLNTYDTQEAQLYTDTNILMANTGVTIDFARQMMLSHQKFLDALQRLTGNSADTMYEVHGVVKDIHVQTTKMNQQKTKQQRILEWMPVVVKGAISTACMVTGAC